MPVSGPLISVTRPGHTYLGLARISASEWRAFKYGDGAYLETLQTLTGAANMATASVHLVSVSPLLVWLGHTSSKIIYNWPIGSAIVPYDYTTDSDSPDAPPGGVVTYLNHGGSVDEKLCVVNHAAGASQNQADLWTLDLAIDPIDTLPGEKSGFFEPLGVVGVGTTLPSGSWNGSPYGANLIPAGGSYAATGSNGPALWLQGYDGGSTKLRAIILGADGPHFSLDCPSPVLLNETFANGAAIAAGRRRGVRLAVGLGGANLIKLASGSWVIGILPEWLDSYVASPPSGLVELQHTPATWTPTDGDSVVTEQGLHASPDGADLVWYVKATTEEPYFIRTTAADGVLGGEVAKIAVEDAEGGVELDVLLPLD